MKRLLSIILCVVLVSFSLCACDSVTRKRVEKFALDTVIVFDLQASSDDAFDINSQSQMIIRYEDMLSATKKDSDIYKINHSAENGVKVSKETAQLIRQAVKISELTDGAFDISVYELVKLWGFDTKKYVVPTDDQIAQTLKKTGYKNIEITDDDIVTVRNGATIDLGGIAKGYIASKVVGSFGDKKSPLDAALVNFGGMVTTYQGNKFRDDGAWVIGVEYPDSNGDYFATFKGVSATTSGPYQRCFEKNGTIYHHIIDPKTGKPAQSDLSSVTITNPCDSYTDALSTAFFVMGREKTIEFIKNNKTESGEKYSVILVSKDKKQVYITEDLLDKSFEIEQSYKNKINVNIIK